ncbi:MAG TPA: hypothetical protein VL463_05555 [Kofleriaceae bacterium]|nr:hypothetical protein [Kofleriaceae bacterium]
MRRLATALLVITTACGAIGGTSAPASDGVRALVSALRSDDPHAAYDLLSADVRKQVSYDQFALEWKQSAPERAWQAKALEESLKGDPDVGERAQVSYRDGKQVQLERDGTAWRLQQALVGRARATAPRDAIRELADALHHKDLAAALALLTARRRDGIARQIEGFVTGLDKRVDGKIEEIGTDRAELRWDENGIRFRVVLRKEDDEWRIDDIVIHPTPEDDSTGEGSGSAAPDVD